MTSAGRSEGNQIKKTVWMFGKAIYVTHGYPYKTEVITYKEVSRFIVGIDSKRMFTYILKESTEC